MIFIGQAIKGEGRVVPVRFSLDQAQHGNSGRKYFRLCYRLRLQVSMIHASCFDHALWGRLVNLRRVGNPPLAPIANLIANRRAGCHPGCYPAPQKWLPFPGKGGRRFPKRIADDPRSQGQPDFGDNMERGHTRPPD